MVPPPRHLDLIRRGPNRLLAGFEVSNYLLDAKPGIGDPSATQPNELGGPGHLRCELIDVDSITINLPHDGVEFGHGFGESSSWVCRAHRRHDRRPLPSTSMFSSKRPMAVSVSA
jgi:hypothetical protein